MFGAARTLHCPGQRVFPGPKGPGNPLNPGRAWDRELQLLLLNEEFPVSASHQLALIKSLPFVHTARRYYRLNDLVRAPDWRSWTRVSLAIQLASLLEARGRRGTRLDEPESCPNLII